MRHVLAAVLVTALVAACGPGAGTPGISATAAPVASVTSAKPTVSPSVTAAPSASATRPATSPHADLGPDIVVEVMTDDLRVRTAPGIGAGSIALEPFLDRGSTLLVTEGPVEEDGYTWVHAMTIEGTTQLTEPGDDVDQELIEHGWIAVGGTDGEPWLTPYEPACPSVPSEPAELVDLRTSEAFEAMVLACFGDEPISMEARIFGCPEVLDIEPPTVCQFGDTGSPSWEPDWFAQSRAYLVAVDGAAGDEIALELHLDPQGTYPEEFPYTEPVEITGRFNHPAASTCTVSHYVQSDQPTAYCRTVFVVTRVEAL